MLNTTADILKSIFPEIGVSLNSGVLSVYYTTTENYHDDLSDVVSGDVMISDGDYIRACKIINKLRESYPSAILYLDSENLGATGSKIHYGYFKNMLNEHLIPYTESTEAIQAETRIVLSVISSPEREGEFMRLHKDGNTIFMSFIYALRKEEGDNFHTISDVAHKKTKEWIKVDDLPYRWLYNYTPIRYGNETGLKIVDGERHLLWNFKEGFNEGDDPTIVNIISSEVSELIYNVFGEENISSVVFICIPTGIGMPMKITCVDDSRDAQRYSDRFSILSNRICNQLGIVNGMSYVSYKEGKPYFDEEYLKGKNIILFDDVLTRGTTAVRVRDELNALGANVLFLVCIAKTKKREVDEKQ